MKRLLAAAAVIGIFAVLPLASAGATTGPEMHFNRIGNIFGLIAPSNGQLSNQAPASGSLHYNGGPIMSQSNSYTIFWQPSGYSFPAGYVNNMNGFFKDLQATQGSNKNTYDNATQYYQQNANGTKTYVQNKVTLAGTTIDTNPLPALDPVNCPDTPVAAAGGVNGSQSGGAAGCVTDAQVQQEISNVVKAKGWPVNNNTEFFMYTAPNIGTCFPATVGEDTGTGVQVNVTAPLCSFSYFCAYHSWYFDSTINANSQIVYANMPYDAQTAGNPLTCDVGDYPNGNASDPEVSTTSHEQNESMTDPFGTGWWDSNSNDSAAGEENGDMCAYDFGTTTGPANAEWNQTINSHHYVMQLEWDNSTNGCPGSDASGNPTAHPNYDTPELFLSPNTGRVGAAFGIIGQFFAAGDSVASKFTDAGVTTALGSATASSSGHVNLLTKVPAKAQVGAATVTSTGKSGTASHSFTVTK
jgi:hypothetical protein